MGRATGIRWLTMSVVLAALVLSVSAAGAQPVAEVAGVVRARDGGIVAGAQVVVVDLGIETKTDESGRYRLRVPAVECVIRVSREGFHPAERSLSLPLPPGDVNFLLESLSRFSEEVTVRAVRADTEAPLTTSELGYREIEQLHYGQEMPFLLKQMPSLTFYSDTGIGAGYSYIYLRGIPQTRMNITLDGAPLNEAEDSALYFVDFGDFTSNVESIQVQRGVGTSTPGAASFVGSINFQSVDLKDEPEVNARLAGGTFGTVRGSLAAHTGAIGPGVKLYGRVSWQDTDGFRDHSGVEQKSVFFGAARQDDRSFWKIFGFAGSERTQLAFLASEKDVLEGNLRDNPLSPDERDSFGQRFVQGQYHHALGASAELSVQGYYNGAGGWYRLRNEAAMPSGLFEYGLDWRMIGASTTLQGQWGRASVTWGFHANDFRSHHTRDVVDSARDYANRGFKNEVSSFGRVGYDADRWHHYADAQVRWARFRYEGDVDLEGVSWTFFNPKLGTRYDLARGLSVYASVGRAMREPTRMDMLSGEDNATVPHDLTAVEPERVVDVETGIDLVRPGFSLQASVYAMEFRDEIALTGELSEIGLPLRRNVDRSYRRGIEVDARWQPRPEVRVHHTANLGRSRIREWTQFFDVYDAGGGYLTSEPRTFEDVAPLLTAAYVGNLAVEWDAAPWLTVGGAGRYVSEAYLDNTSNEAFTTPGWFTLDASAAVKLGGFVKTGAPVLRIFVDNVLNDDRLFPSGYSYLYLERDAGGRDIPRGIAYYYPLATRSVFVTLDLSLR